MKIKELIRQLKEYEKIYGPDMIVVTHLEEIVSLTEDEIEDEEIKLAGQTVDGLDYIGDSTILITSHEE